MRLCASRVRCRASAPRRLRPDSGFVTSRARLCCRVPCANTQQVGQGHAPGRNLRLAGLPWVTTCGSAIEQHGLFSGFSHGGGGLPFSAFPWHCRPFSGPTARATANSVAFRPSPQPTAGPVPDTSRSGVPGHSTMACPVRSQRARSRRALVRPTRSMVAGPGRPG